MTIRRNDWRVRWQSDPASYGNQTDVDKLSENSDTKKLAVVLIIVIPEID